jgi:hypothetical protein
MCCLSVLWDKYKCLERSKSKKILTIFKLYFSRPFCKKGPAENTHNRLQRWRPTYRSSLLIVQRRRSCFVECYTVVTACVFRLCDQCSIPAICSRLIIISPQSHVRRVFDSTKHHWMSLKSPWISHSEVDEWFSRVLKSAQIKKRTKLLKWPPQN